MNLKKKTVIALIASVFIVALVVVIICLRLREDSLGDDTLVNMNFVINDTLNEGEGQKVRVFLLAGQSNASGVARTSELKKNVSEDKFEEYQEGYDNIYINYYNENGNRASLGFTNLAINQGCGDGYFGPELGMGERLKELYPNETIFIIKYSWGGTNLYKQWNSKTGNIYKAFIKYVKESMDYLFSKNYDAEIVSMMWMQGESDAFNPYAKQYEDNLLNFISSTRKELKNYICNEGMYFIDAYISSSPYWSEYVRINKAKQSVCDSGALNVCVNTIEEALTFDREPEGEPDLAHYDSLSELKLGHLFVEVFEENCGDN